MKNSSKKLKVAFVYDDSLDGFEGVTQQVKLIGGWLSGRGHEVSYFVGQTKLTSWRGGKVYSLAKNLSVHFNGNKLSIPRLSKKSEIKAALAEAAPDVLHVQMPHSPLMAQRVINASDAKTGVVGSFHIYPAGALAKLGSKLLVHLYGRGLSRLDEVVSVSLAAQQFARDSFGLKTKIIPNAVDVASFKNQAKNKPLQIVFLGRLVPRKGCRELILAFAKVQQELPDARLLIGGDGPQRSELVRLVDRLGLSDKVQFKGFIAEADKPAFLASGAVACFPSLYGESFGIVLIEAMAAGCGVVCGGNNPGYTSVLAARPELLFNPKDSNELARKLIDFLTNQTSQQAAHTWQKSEVKKYDIDAVGPRLEALYTRAIAKSRRAGHN